MNKQFKQNTDKLFEYPGFLSMTKYALKEYGLAGSVARFLLMKSETNRFIQSGIGQKSSDELAALVAQFSKIQSNVNCAHSPYQFILLAKYILDLKIPGPIVECGCFKGGSSAKLSILAKITSRDLWICDSFQGLPESRIVGEERLIGYGNNTSCSFAAGDYMGTLEEVKNNIHRLGHIDVCTFVSGFFENSLPQLNVKPACVVMDVDLVSSARDCLKNLWPNSPIGSVWFTHEAGFPDYINGIMDHEWWRAEVGENPPIIFGAGSGLSECAQGMAMFVKK